MIHRSCNFFPFTTFAQKMTLFHPYPPRQIKGRFQATSSFGTIFSVSAEKEPVIGQEKCVKIVALGLCWIRKNEPPRVEAELPWANKPNDVAGGEREIVQEKLSSCSLFLGGDTKQDGGSHVHAKKSIPFSWVKKQKKNLDGQDLPDERVACSVLCSAFDSTKGPADLNGLWHCQALPAIIYFQHFS